MAELPDLEVIKEVLNNKVCGIEITKVEIPEPLVFRCLLDEFTQALQGAHIAAVNRRGKFLLMALSSGPQVVIHPMLTGRLQLCEKMERLKPHTCLRLHLLIGQELRYYDSQLFGRIYLVRNNDFSYVPQFVLLGPEPLDENLTFDAFRERLRKHRGIIKNVLTNQRFLAGIGNAYADEILFAAGLFPHRQASSLRLEEIERLYHAVRSVLADAIHIIRSRIGTHIDVKLRDFLKVHNKGGQPCPRCGTRISQLTPNNQIISFCRSCQK